MAAQASLEELARQLATLDRPALLDRLHQFERPKLDFSDEFLDAQSEDRLRHLLLAACIQARRAAPRGRRT